MSRSDDVVLSTTTRGSPGQELLEDVVGLLAKLAPVAEKEDALGPAGPHQEFAERNGDARLARARGLNEQRAAELLLEALAHALDGLELVHALGDAEVRGDGGERLFVLPLVEQVLEAVLRVEAVDLARRVPLRVVPDVDVDAVRVEDDGALAGLLLEARGVDARLLGADARVLGGLLRLDDSERLAVVAVEDVVGVALARLRRHRREPHLLAHLLGALAVRADVPACVEQLLVDEPVARRLLAQLKDVGCFLPFGADGRELLGRVRDVLLGGLALAALLLEVGEELLELRLLLRELVERLLLLLLQRRRVDRGQRRRAP